MAKPKKDRDTTPLPLLETPMKLYRASAPLPPGAVPGFDRIDAAEAARRNALQLARQLCELLRHYKVGADDPEPFLTALIAVAEERWPGFTFEERSHTKRKQTRHDTRHLLDEIALARVIYSKTDNGKGVEPACKAMAVEKYGMGAGKKGDRKSYASDIRTRYYALKKALGENAFLAAVSAPTSR